MIDIQKRRQELAATRPALTAEQVENHLRLEAFFDGLAPDHIITHEELAIAFGSEEIARGIESIIDGEDQ